MEQENKAVPEQTAEEAFDDALEDAISYLYNQGITLQVSKEIEEVEVEEEAEPDNIDYLNDALIQLELLTMNNGDEKAKRLHTDLITLLDKKIKR